MTYLLIHLKFDHLTVNEHAHYVFFQYLVFAAMFFYKMV